MQHPDMDPRGSISAPKITTFQIVKEQKKGDRSIFPFFVSKLLPEPLGHWICPLVSAECGGKISPLFQPGGGARRDRTADLLLAKQVLSQLSYGPLEWWVWVDLNHRPHPYQGCALTN